MPITKEQFLATMPEVRKPVPVPGTGVFVPDFSAAEGVAFRAFVQKHQEDDGDHQAAFLCRVIVDEHGTRLFSDEDVPLVKRRIKMNVADAVIATFGEVNGQLPKG